MWKDETFLCDVREVARLSVKALKKYLAETSPAPTTLKGNLMANFPLNTGDSVTVTLTDTDNVTGLVVTPDPGSVTVTLSSTTDTVTGTYPTFTLTAGTVDGTDNTITVEAEVNGIASEPWVGTYDVVAVTPDATTLTGVFGTEVAPDVTNTAPSTATNPVTGEAIPEGFVFNEATGGLDHV